MGKSVISNALTGRYVAVSNYPGTTDEKAMSCHSSCAFNGGCGVICCPNCGYQVIDEQKLPTFVLRV